MGRYRLHTGDDYADFTIEQRLSQMPEYWALVKYLENKGLLDRDEFWEVLTEVCAKDVKTAKQLVNDQDD